MDASRPPREFSARRLFFESLLIIVSVLVGFAVSEWRQRAADRTLAAQVLAGVRVEVEHNLTQLNEQISRHQQLIKQLESVNTAAGDGQTAWDVLLGIMMKMHGGLNTAPMRQAAWDQAVSTGALRLLDYETGSAISEIYRTQIDVYNPVIHLISAALYVPSAFDAAKRREMLQMMRWLTVELEGNERFLRDLYAKNLPLLRR